MTSDFAIYLRKELVKSLRDAMTQQSPDRSLLIRFLPYLSDDYTFPTGPESISLLYHLKDAITDWRFSRQRNKVIRGIFCLNDETKIKKAISTIEAKLKAEGDPQRRQPHSLLEDRFTSYNSGSSSRDDIFSCYDEHVQAMVDCLRESSEGFKAVGIYGMGGSGKSTLVKHVLNQVPIPGKFEPNIIWTCLSHLTKEDEVGIEIGKYILYDLGFDVDGHIGDDDDYHGWVIKQLELELHKLGNYVIVLDDVWHCNEWLSGFYNMLSKSTSGTIIVTSRIEQVVRKTVGGGENSLMIDLIPCEGQKGNEFMKNLVCSQSDEQVTNDDGNKELIGACHGLPLAAKVLSSVNMMP